ncbi:VOC family protein [Diaminobutyricibacter sp. McL0618]|uniref:VOC family protein n=1 Tax=Leifsonia sp. McL0618 TaxID=3415677 RepID=UPI003CEF9FB3
MPVIDTFPAGTPVWVDLQSPDPEGAVAFYRDLFGWEVVPPTAEMGGYSVASIGGTPVTAIGPLPPMIAEAGGRSTWTTYFVVDDIGRAASAATDEGGQVLVPPGELARGVYLAIVSDPTGAVFGLWQQEKGTPWLRNEPGAVDWLELVAEGYEESLSFYENVLTVGVSQMPLNEGVYTLFDVGDANVAGAMAPVSPETPSHWLAYFQVVDLDASLERVLGLGGATLSLPMSASGVGRWAVVTDPFGGAFALLEPEREAA